MPFKTPSKNSEFIRGILKKEKDPVVAEILSYADANMIPVLLPESAVFLEQIVALSAPEKALEIGTAVGYSTQLILRNCSGVVTTVEINENYAETARKNLEKLGYGGRFTLFVGDAGEILPFMDGTYDFIFMDGPKTRYIEYLPHLKRMLAKGGVMLCDNVLFNGMVSGEGDIRHSKLTIINGITNFLKAVSDDEEFVTSILPVGDGMSLTLRKKL